mmetsp:Transcript_12236/g.18525  ORF Transcript_12236/g.18525 Transcript_12236/m.18525 type:complete len:302 (-) Transcript_12236:190-1095(-)|eukprot:CAMPEP_0185040032 /NCGR_PEP_ID=MMETSP1103-20130426/37625_1 /TAXON_ID=36769 /ORGANISM="Paraphysomonas bandaiensis, Strain Caron Lab Isolate" /LENGTH=301 /DNA_ID=CAMNT_0027579161 /DNA_START=67 /DNA_END=972 /DNA_ORIENTATION=+
MLRKIIASDGVALALHEYAHPDKYKRLLLFSHATGFHGRVFDSTIRHLTDQFNCVSLDHRGHGSSGWNNDEVLKWERFGEDIVHVSDDIVNHSSEKIIGIGHSMGATSLILASLKYPEKFSGLVLYEPVIMPLLWRMGGRLRSFTKEMPLAEMARKRRMQFPSFAHAITNFTSKPPMNTFAPGVVKDYVMHGFETVSSGNADESCVQLRCLPDVEASIYNTGHLHNTWDSLHNISVPVWIMSGRKETYQMSAVAAKIAQLIPDSKFVQWDDVSHFGPLEQPTRFAEFIQDVERQLDETDVS